LQALQLRLREEHEAYRKEMDQVQAAVESKSARLDAQLADLDSRTGNLDQSVRRLESNLDDHLEQVAREIISAAQTNLQSAAGVVLKELKANGANELANQVGEARGRLNNIQREIEVSISESLKVKVAEAMQAFEQTMEELAQHSVGRWRLALAKDLNSVATLLGEKIRSEARCDTDD
jgi:DNA anti-recombination protein RmuC